MTKEELLNKIAREQEIKSYIEDKEAALGVSSTQDVADKAACDAKIAAYQQAIADMEE